MLVNPVDMQQVNPPRDSTESSETGGPVEDRQPKADYYAKWIGCFFGRPPRVDAEYFEGPHAAGPSPRPAEGGDDHCPHL